MLAKRLDAVHCTVASPNLLRSPSTDLGPHWPTQTPSTPLPVAVVLYADIKAICFSILFPLHSFQNAESYVGIYILIQKETF